MAIPAEDKDVSILAPFQLVSNHKVTPNPNIQEEGGMEKAGSNKVKTTMEDKEEDWKPAAGCKSG